MDQINDIARTAEFSSLREVLSPETNAEVTCTCAVTSNGNINDTGRLKVIALSCYVKLAGSIRHRSGHVTPW